MDMVHNRFAIEVWAKRKKVIYIDGGVDERIDAMHKNMVECEKQYMLHLN